MDSINPNFKRFKRNQNISAQALLKPLLEGNRAALSRALTLLESRLSEHRAEAEKLIQAVLPHTGRSLRMGITGVPGVGKSTFIEAFGQTLIGRGKKIAVLAIDPSSARSGGSILGDKTRMETLSQMPEAFIRPSPTGGSLGGVARKTREAILLCEAAGFDLVLIETVGVGQSETAVKNMVDFFMLLMLAGAGDELQGIKRGIMEMADLLVINKADDPKDPKVKMAMGEYKRALHLFPPNPNEWIPKVSSCSALKMRGMEEIISILESFEQQQKLKGYFEQNRKEQALHWFEESMGDLILESAHQNKNFEQRYQSLRKEILGGQIEPSQAAHQLVKTLFS
jgi:LAO/AO transport system kinase